MIGLLKSKKCKGFINILELIIVSVVLITAFAALFPGLSYKSEWDSAQLLLRGRDVAFTVDGIGRTYEYSFDSNSFDDFLATIFSESSLITWSNTKDAVKNTVRISCVCDNNQIDALNSWLLGVRINGRPIEFIVYQSTLDSIIPSDVLVIWSDNIDLSSYRLQIEDYLIAGGGIVEVMDFFADVGDVQRDIFGIDNGIEWGNDVNLIVKPDTGNQLTYQTYKLFYNLPYRLSADAAGETTSKCTQSNMTGSFTVRELNRQFWVCDSTSVYFDTNGDGEENTGALYAGDEFTIDGFDFRIAYVDSADQVRIAFESTEYEFVDFIQETGIESIKPSDDDYSRAFVIRTNVAPEKACGVVLNNASSWRTAWIANFTEDGLGVGDDLKNLIISLLLWASNKEKAATITDLRVGYVTSFVNVYEMDVLELYKLDFGIGYPY